MILALIAINADPEYVQFKEDEVDEPEPEQTECEDVESDEAA